MACRYGSTQMCLPAKIWLKKSLVVAFSVVIFFVCLLVFFLNNNQAICCLNGVIPFGSSRKTLLRQASVFKISTVVRSLVHTPPGADISPFPPLSAPSPSLPLSVDSVCQNPCLFLFIYFSLVFVRLFIIYLFSVGMRDRISICSPGQH